MSPAFDYTGTLKRFGNDRQLFAEMVGFFFADTPPCLSALRAGVEESDFSKIKQNAHTLKGLAANFGAAPTMMAAALIEQHAEVKNLKAIEMALPMLEEAVGELQTALASHQAQTDGAAR